MRQYLLVQDNEEVLGVWVAENIVSATRLKLELALKYPGCETVSSDATSYDEFKQVYGGYEFGDLQPVFAR